MCIVCRGRLKRPHRVRRSRPIWSRPYIGLNRSILYKCEDRRNGQHHSGQSFSGENGHCLHRYSVVDDRDRIHGDRVRRSRILGDDSGSRKLAFRFKEASRKPQFIRFKEASRKQTCIRIRFWQGSFKEPDASPASRELELTPPVESASRNSPQANARPHPTYENTPAYPRTASLYALV